jgi:hypothetical protein
MPRIPFDSAEQGIKKPRAFNLEREARRPLAIEIEPVGQLEPRVTRTHARTVDAVGGDIGVRSADMQGYFRAA